VAEEAVQERRLAAEADEAASGLTVQLRDGGGRGVAQGALDRRQEDGPSCAGRGRRRRRCMEATAATPTREQDVPWPDAPAGGGAAPPGSGATAGDGRRAFLPDVARRVGMRPYPRHRLFVVQHLLEDTQRLLETLHPLLEIDVVIGVAYSTRPRVVEALRRRGIRVRTPAFAELEATIAEELAVSIRRSERDGRRVIVQEVGGYVVPLLHARFRHALRHFAGCVEVTKQGVWRARRVPDLALPHLHCAESVLKRVEALQVGEAVVTALDALTRGLGWALAGRLALVLGYGWIGRATCRALRRRDAIVGVHDPDALRLVEAKLEGCATPALDEWLPRVSLVVGATGVRSVTAGLIARLPDGAVLASASSRDVEIDLVALRRASAVEAVVAAGVRRLRTADGRALYLLNDGYPVNFSGTSVPDEVVELIFAEVLVLVHELATRPHPPGVAGIPPALEAVPALAWLEQRDPHRRSGPGEA
jgi:adenosylhomocysteinase